MKKARTLLALLFLSCIITVSGGCTSDDFNKIVEALKSSNADLSSITLSHGTLTPGFDSTITSYAVSVNFILQSMSITPTVDHADATIIFNA